MSISPAGLISSGISASGHSGLCWPVGDVAWKV